MGIESRDRGRGPVLILIALLLGCRAAAAQVEPLGPEFQVNSYTTGFQGYPRATARPDGGFTVAWCCGGAAEGRPVLGRGFGADGQPIDGELQISEHSSDVPTGMAATAAGDFVVAWGQGTPGPGGGSPSDLHGRRMGVDGTPLGAQFVVNEGGPREYLYGGPLAMLTNDSFVVVWDLYGAWGQRFAPDGGRLGANFEIEGSPGHAFFPAVAPQPDGGFVVAWEDRIGYDVWDVRARRYGSDGVPRDESLVVSEDDDWDWNVAVAAASDGSFAVAWSAWNGQMDRIRARWFSGSGEPFGEPIVVDAGTAEFQSLEDVAVDANGEFVILWSSRSQTPDPDGWSLHARRHAREGTPLGAEFQVESYTTGNQYRASVAATTDGDFVVTWTSRFSAGDDDSETSVQARRFRSPFFIDGFETGDLSRWSSIGS